MLIEKMLNQLRLCLHVDSLMSVNVITMVKEEEATNLGADLTWENKRRGEREGIND